MIKKLKTFRRSGAILSFLGALLLIGGIANAWVYTHTHSQGISTQETTLSSQGGSVYCKAVGPSSGFINSDLLENGSLRARAIANSNEEHCAQGGFVIANATHLFRSTANVTTGVAKGYAWDTDPQNKVPICPAGEPN